MLASEIAWSQRDGGRREIVSPLVADDGQQTFFSFIRWDLVFLLSKVLTTLQCTATSKQVGSCLANANSKIFFACGANKKAFGQIDQPKGTKPREIRTLGVRRKVELRLQRADRQQTKKTKKKTKETKDAKKKRYGVHYLSL